MKRVKFEIKTNGEVQEVLTGELVKSRGVLIVKGDDGRVYDPMGWENDDSGEYFTGDPKTCGGHPDACPCERITGKCDD